MRNEMYLVLNSLQNITGGMRQLHLQADHHEPLRYELYLVFDKKVSIKISI
jgi:hypothetical protein